MTGFLCLCPAQHDIQSVLGITFWKGLRSSRIKNVNPFLERIGPRMILPKCLPNKQSLCLFSRDSKMDKEDTQ